jgi:hypothetical protein
MSQQINLFDPAYGPQRKPFSARAMAWSLLLVVLVVALFHGYVLQQTRSVERLLADADARLADQRERVRSLGVEIGAGASRPLADEVARLEARLSSRRQVLREVTSGLSGNVEGYSGLMAGLARSARTGLWLTGFTVNEQNAIEIRGRVLDAAAVPAYIQSLNREQSLQGRAVSDMKLAAKAEPEPDPKSAPARVTSAPTRYVEFTLHQAPRESGEASRGGTR